MRRGLTLLFRSRDAESIIPQEYIISPANGVVRDREGSNEPDHAERRTIMCPPAESDWQDFLRGSIDLFWDMMRPEPIAI